MVAVLVGLKLRLLRNALRQSAWRIVGVVLATAYGLGAEGLGLRRLVAETAADNVASNKILESLGFTRWGVEDAATAPDNSIGPAAHWELLSPPQG